jgi:Tfp pilus assembly protein PilO
MNPNYLSNKVKDTVLNFIVPIVCLVVALLLFVAVIYPTFKRKPLLEKELQNKQALETTLTKKLANLNRLVDFKALVDENSKLVDKALPSSGMVPELLSQIDFIARSSGFDVTKLSYAISKDESGDFGYSLVDVSLGATGTYDKLVSFFKLVEGAIRVINVDSYHYVMDTRDLKTLEMNLVLRSPYLFVDSTAVTDEMVDLDITSTAFTSFVNRVKSMKYYDPLEISKPVEEKKTETPKKTTGTIPSSTAPAK